jgi:hypothetical protein
MREEMAEKLREQEAMYWSGKMKEGYKVPKNI